MKRMTAALVFLCGLVFASAPSGAQEPAIRYILNSDKVLQVVTRMGYMTILEFPSTVDEVYCGDLGAFGIEVVGRRVIIKALSPGAHSNLVTSIGTDRRYIFDLLESPSAPPNFLVTLIDPEHGMGFAALVEMINKGHEDGTVFVTEVNQLSRASLPSGQADVAVIRLLRDTRRNISAVWWRLYNPFKKIDERDISLEGFTRIAVIADIVDGKDVFVRNCRDIIVVVSGVSLTGNLTLVMPWNGEVTKTKLPNATSRYYEPAGGASPLRHFRVWVDTFVDESTGAPLEIPGHYDHFEVRNYLERGVTG